MDAVTERRRHYLHYVDHVTDLCRDPGTRRRLASGRGQSVDQGGQLMHRHISAQVRGHSGRRAHYTIASLIARHRPDTATGAAYTAPGVADSADPADAQAWRARPNLGVTYALAVAGGRLNLKPTEDRLEGLAQLGTELLHHRLGSEVDHLHRIGHSPDWALLLEDLVRWPWQQPQIGGRWVEQFYFALTDRT